MSELIGLKDRLEILIITYNRCKYLSATLQMLGRSPFRDSSITVIDNCSSDATSDAVESCLGYFTSLKYVRNRLNIGGNPNYLKAIELSSSEYTWILCDDDFLDFSCCDDIVEAVVSGAYDLVEVGANEKGRWPRGIVSTVRDLVDMGLDYHNGLSFFPAYIFRTSLFDSSCFCWGYNNIDRLYPQFEFLNKSLLENFSIYLAKHRIVIRNNVSDNSFLPLHGYASWASCCRTIKDRKMRARVIEDYTADRSFLMCLCFWTILDRKMNDGDFWLRVVAIFCSMSFGQRMRYLLVLPYALLPLPLSFWIWIRATIYELMKVPSSEVPSVRFVNRG